MRQEEQRKELNKIAHTSSSNDKRPTPGHTPGIDGEALGHEMRILE
jgi:hypothetical protein